MKEGNDNDKDLISRYLLGQLKDQELQQFSLRLMRDRAFQKEVDDNRLLMKTLWKANQIADKKNKNNGFNRPWLWGILIAIPILVAIPFFLTRSDNETLEKPIENFNLPTEQPSPEIQQIKEEEVTPFPEQTREEEPENAPPRQEPISTNRPIAAADFSPNPSLELLINNPLRADDFQLVLSQPTNGDTLNLEDGTLVLNIRGDFQRSDQTIIPSLKYYLFSNKEAAFENFDPVSSLEITFDESNGINSSFALTESLVDLKPGLYYLMISDEAGDNLYHLSRVIVR